MSIQNILSRVPERNRNDVEIECRFYIDPRGTHTTTISLEQTENLVRYLVESAIKDNITCEISQTINFIKNNKEQRLGEICQLSFVNGISRKENPNDKEPAKIFYSKKKLGSETFDIKNSYISYTYSVNISTEIKQQKGEIILEMYDTAKVRFRITLYYEEWNIDISLVKYISKDHIKSNLKSIKESIFPSNKKYNLSDSKFLSELPWNKIDTIEIEAEFNSTIDEFQKNPEGKIAEANTIIMQAFEQISKSNGSDGSDDDIDTNQDNNDLTSGSNDEWRRGGGLTTTSVTTGGSGGGDLYKQILFEVAKMMERKDSSAFLTTHSIRKLGNFPRDVTFSIFTNDILKHITDFYITDKVDGLRTIMFYSPSEIYGKNKIYLLSFDLRVYEMNDDPIFDKIKQLSGPCVLDCEEYSHIIGGYDKSLSINNNSILGGYDEGSRGGYDKDQEKVYYLFDVMVWDGVLMANKPFTDRLKLFDTVASIIPIIRSKPFIRLTDKFKDEIIEFKKQKRLYDVDGIILTPYNKTYEEMIVYKYKPADKQTIDFVVMECPKILLGKHPYLAKEGYKLYLLFCGISKSNMISLGLTLLPNYQDIFPNLVGQQYLCIQFCPSSNMYNYLYYHECDYKDDTNSLNNTVCEFRYNIRERRWVYLKTREDKTYKLRTNKHHQEEFGNNFKIAELIFINYYASFEIENYDKMGIYFQERDDDLQKLTRSFNNFVKSHYITKYFTDTDWVLDMCCGNGQDLFKYRRAGISNVLFTDRDAYALAELINRKYNFYVKTSKGMAIYVKQIDYTQPYLSNVTAIEKATFPLIRNNMYKEKEREKEDGRTTKSRQVQRLQNKYCISGIVCNLAIHYFMKDENSFINVLNFIMTFLRNDGIIMFTCFDGKAVYDLLNTHGGHWKSRTQGKFAIKRKYFEKSFLPYGQKIDVLLPFSKDVYYEEYLVNVDYVTTLLGMYGIKLVERELFSKFTNEFLSIPKNSNEMFDEDDILYTNLYTCLIFTLPKKK